jgi:Sec-independent protein translocase protein TatA
MILTVGFLLVLGLIVFGPKKTIEIAQEVGRDLAQVKKAADQFQQSALGSEPGGHRAESSPSPIPPLQGPPG